jgi:hypothetical protein
MGQTGFAGHHHRGASAGLSTAVSPEHPFRAGERSMTSSRSAAFSFARRRILAGPCGLPRTRRQDASNSVSTTDVTRHEHPSKHPLWRPLAGAPWENPPAFDFADRPRPRGRAARPSTTPDHLAVIRPPAAARLTARCRLRADRRSLLPMGTVTGERRCFFGSRRLCRVEPSGTSPRGRIVERRSTPSPTA